MSRHPATNQGPDNRTTFKAGLWTEGAGVACPDGAIIDGNDVELMGDGSISPRWGYDAFQPGVLGKYTCAGAINIAGGTACTNASGAFNTLGIEAGGSINPWFLTIYDAVNDVNRWFRISSVGSATAFTLYDTSPVNGNFGSWAIVYGAPGNMIHLHGDNTDKTKKIVLVQYGRRLDKIASDGTITILKADLTAGSATNYLGYRMRAVGIGKETLLDNGKDLPLSFNYDSGLATYGATSLTAPTPPIFLFSATFSNSAGNQTDTDTNGTGVPTRLYGIARTPVGAAGGSYGAIQKTVPNTPVIGDATGTSQVSSPSRYRSWMKYTYKNECPIFFSPDEIYSRYSTGTVAITDGSTTVVGTGTSWSGAVAVGDVLILLTTTTAPSTSANYYNDQCWAPYRVEAVTDNTHITVDRPVRATASGLSYVIAKNQATVSGSITMSGAAFYPNGTTAKATSPVFPSVVSPGDLLVAFTQSVGNLTPAGTTTVANATNVNAAADAVVAATHRVWRITVRRTAYDLNLTGYVGQGAAPENSAASSALFVDFKYRNRYDSMSEVTFDGGATWFPIVGYEESANYTANVTVSAGGTAVTSAACTDGHHALVTFTGGFNPRTAGVIAPESSATATGTGANQSGGGTNDFNWTGGGPHTFYDSAGTAWAITSMGYDGANYFIRVYRPAAAIPTTGVGWSIKGITNAPIADYISSNDQTKVIGAMFYIYSANATTPAVAGNTMMFRPQQSSSVILPDRGNTIAPMKGNTPVRYGLVNSSVSTSEITLQMHDGPLYGATKFALIKGIGPTATYGLQLFRTRANDPTTFYESSTALGNVASTPTKGVQGVCVYDAVPEYANTSAQYVLPTTGSDPSIAKDKMYYLGVVYRINLIDRDGNNPRPQTIEWSKPDQPNVKNGYLTLTKDATRGEGVRLFVLNEVGYALMSKGVYILPGDTPMQVLPKLVEPNYGIVAPDSLQVLDGYAFWVDEFAVVIFDGQRGQDISPAIRNLLLGLSTTQKATIVSGIIDNRYAITIPHYSDDLTKAKTFVYDMPTQSWMPYGKSNWLLLAAYHKCNTFHANGDQLYLRRATQGLGYINGPSSLSNTVMKLSVPNKKCDSSYSGEVLTIAAKFKPKRVMAGTISVDKSPSFVDMNVITAITGGDAFALNMELGDGTNIPL